MSDATTTGTMPPTAGERVLEPARIGPVARFVKVLFSPGAVFEDIRRDPRGWWVPIIINSVLFTIFATIYVGKYDLGLVMREQAKDGFIVKMARAFGGPEAGDKALEEIVKQSTSVAVWQIQATQWVNILVGFTIVVWFFMFLYGLIAVLMGWLPESVKTSKLWINLGLVAATGVGLVVLSIAVNAVNAVMMKRAGGDASASAPGWLVFVNSFLALAAIGMILWLMSRLAREIAFGRIIGVVSYALAPAGVSALLGVIIVLIRAPDATWMEDLVPANLALLLNMSKGGAVAALGSSLNLFTIWTMVLAIVGLAKVLGRPMAATAAAVLAPWGLWVVVKITLAAILGS